jgi:radical SAM protein with 4Fe4S-binding SPASM domain
MLDDYGQLINPEIRLEITNICNARCEYCPREKLTRDLDMMSFVMFKEYVWQGYDLGVKMVSLFGFGEPMLHAKLVDMVRFCNVLGLSSFITTNGSMLSPTKARDLLDAGLTDLRISIHSLDRNRYEKIHRGLYYESVLRDVINTINIRDRDDYPTKIHITSIPKPVEDVDWIKSFWSKFDVYLEIWHPHNWGPGREYRDISSNGSRKKTCGRPFNGPVQVQVDGTIIPCCFLTNSEMIMGNARKEAIASILRNDAYETLRKQHACGDVPWPCNSCDQLEENGINPLRWSNRDPERNVGRTSSLKFGLV